MSDLATYYGANGWLLEIAGMRVLVDPWLTGDLVFPPGAWWLRGELPHPSPIPDSIDLLLLTQGLADHAHPPTLQQLPKQLPVLASGAAAKVVRKLGFETVCSLRPGESTAHGPLQIRATAGAAVPNVENGYLIEWSGGSLYLEPHGVLDPTLTPRAVDTVITPVVNLGLPLLGDFITGATVLPQLLERFQPRTVLASTTGGDVRFSGLISQVLQAGSGQPTMPRVDPKRCQLIHPEPGTPILLSGESTGNS